VNRDIAKQVADAVLYEGYMLYPYRPSAIKNRQRWSFGILYPPSYTEVRSGTERCGMHSEFLLEIESDAKVHIQLRFLHLVARQVAKSIDPQCIDPQIEDERFESVASLRVEDRLVESWDEGVERSVEFELASLAGPQQMVQFRFPGSRTIEPLKDHAGRLVGRISRTQYEVMGTVAVSSEKVDEGVCKLTIGITNDVPYEVADEGTNDVANPTLLASDDRNSALLRSLLSAHTILAVRGGKFISLLEPPERLRDVVSACRNVGNFPVLVGATTERELLLCSPIVLYDYPQIAPESASDFFDATEMDEMLTLRVLTLTDEEKDEMRRGDDHARDLLQRTEQSAREQLMRTHGILRPVGEKA
jgi:hydrogenase maturation protease